jgi:hypothetical protein
VTTDNSNEKNVPQLHEGPRLWLVWGDDVDLDRDYAMARMAADGASNKNIAKAFGTTSTTVRHALTHLCEMEAWFGLDPRGARSQSTEHAP